MKKYVDAAVWENDYRERLKKLIAENNITARELSLSLGYNEGYISRILKGKIDPSFKSMMDTMLYFDMSPAEFFTFDLLRTPLREITSTGEIEQRFRSN